MSQFMSRTPVKVMSAPIQPTQPIFHQQQAFVHTQQPVTAPVVADVKGEKQPLKLTKQKIESAFKHQKYMKAYGTSDLSLAGCHKFWEKNPTYVYVSTYRIAGSPEDVKQVIQAYDPTVNINNVMFEAYSVSSITNPYVRGKFEAELSQIKNFKTQLKSEREKEKEREKSFDTICEQISSRKFKVVESREHMKNGEVIQEYVPIGRKGVKKNQAFTERLASTPIGKVLDVSSLTPEGKGAKTISHPTELSQKKTIGDLRLASSTAEGMANALTLIGRVDLIPEFNVIIESSKTKQ